MEAGKLKRERARNLTMGEFFLSSGGTDCVVINYLNCDCVTVKFLDDYGYEITTSASNLRKRNFANPYDITVRGFGFMGVGEYKSRENPYNSKKTSAYEVWGGMIKRCYSEASLLKNPSYVGCTVCEDWRDFQVFAEWYTNHEFYGVGYQLDKDILFRGNKVYSPETCCMIPQEINILSNNNTKFRGKYPLGVTIEGSKYLVQLSINGKNKRLGLYETPEMAYQVYLKAKKDYIKNLALFWEGRIEDKVFKVLMDWEVVDV